MSWSTYWCVPHPATRPRSRGGGRDLRLRLLQPGRGRPCTSSRPDREGCHGGFLAALVVSFGVIFVAELGDKSQLMALTFATRFKPIPVLIGITVATAVVHLASVGDRRRSRGGAADRLDLPGGRRGVPRLRRVDAAR